MELLTRLNELQGRVVAALHHLPGATELYLFGSRVSTPDDPYADIDLHVMSGDLAASRRVWPTFLQKVGPIESIVPLEQGPDNLAFSVQFRYESLYHKLDISIGTPAQGQHDANAEYVQLWQQEPPPAASTTYTTDAYHPAYGSVGHRLCEELISGVRYLKARQREQHLTCWRFIRGKPDIIFQLLFEQGQRHPPAHRALTTLDYKDMDARIAEPERRELLAMLDWSTPVAMDRSFCALLERMIPLFREQAHTTDQHLPEKIIERYVDFLSSELAHLDGVTKRS